MPATLIERCPDLGARRGFHGLPAVLGSLALVLAPIGSRAAPPANEDPAAAREASDATESEVESEVEPESEPGVEVEVEHRDVPSGGGVAGAIVDPDDPNATRAQSDLEGESLAGEVDGVPERLPKLQAAGWWMTFTAVALATSGGIFAGIAEVREDEAERLAYGFDLSTGRTTTYGPVAGEYQRLLDEGHSYQWVARGLIIAGGVALITGVALFAVDGVQRRKAARSSAARLQLAPGGLTLRF
ncbi:MAG: hypothetical protein R6X02_13570 [Enhygromyxa sp.]